jgi:hypothetical protein
MNKDKFLQLHKQHSLETCYMSFTDTNHPAYIELATLKNEYGIVWALERLKDSIGHDTDWRPNVIGEYTNNICSSYDPNNNPWLSIALLGKYTDGVCWKGFSDEHAGMLNEIRAHLINWGKNQNFI